MKIAYVRAKALYDYAVHKERDALYSWDLEAEDDMSSMFQTLDDPHQAYMNALRAGVKLGLFEEPVWERVRGMTPYAGSARRNKMFKVKKDVVM